VNKIKSLWKKLGVGFITGAANDEPSGIATYSIAGARFGLSSLWMALFSLPLMIAIQEMAGRIGRVTNLGLAGNMKKFYPRWVLFSIAILMVGVNTINIGADMSGMAQSVATILPIPEKLGAVLITLIILIATIFLPYQKIFTIFKWLTLSLLAYIFAAFTIHQDWPRIFYHLIIPHVTFSKDFFIVLTAFFGTTIAPYMFFWQANQEVEEKIIEQCKPGRLCRLKPANQEDLKILNTDTRIGMIFSNLVTFFIVILASTTLFRAGLHNIESLKDAAEALRPLAGDFSYLLFTLGIVSSGFLAIPVLAGSAAYIVAEVFNWPNGLNKTFTKAKEFYGIILVSTIIGLLIPLLGFHTVKALFYTAILYGIISPIIIFMILHMANNKKVMGEFTNSKQLNFWGYLAFAVMAFLALSIFFLL